MLFNMSKTGRFQKFTNGISRATESDVTRNIGAGAENMRFQFLYLLYDAIIKYSHRSWGVCLGSWFSQDPRRHVACTHWSNPSNMWPRMGLLQPQWISY